MSKVFDFVLKYQQKSVDYDGSYGCQCVDLVRQYIKEILKTRQPGAVQGAKDLVNTIDKTVYGLRSEHYSSPQIGDILVITAGKYGHTAIVTDIKQDYIQVLEQDGFNQSLKTYLKWYKTNKNMEYIYVK